MKGMGAQHQGPPPWVVWYSCVAGEVPPGIDDSMPFYSADQAGLAVWYWAGRWFASSVRPWRMTSRPPSQGFLVLDEEGGYWVRLPLLLLMLFNGRLVGLLPPPEVRQ
jgi:hypothetical protein